MTSASLDRVGDRGDLEALRPRPWRATREPSRRPTRHVDAGVAQVQRVRVPLAAVADDGDLLGWR